jgi:DNA ligase-associated metallophosphoesterase
MLEVTVQGETLTLLPEGAVFWPRRSMLIIADPHFGKDDLFRRAGIAVPRGPTAADLRRLSEVLERTRATTLRVLGDFLHGSSEHDDDLWRVFVPWRERHAGLTLQLVSGNHDRHEDWTRWRGLLERSEAALVEPPFVFAHDPESDARGYVIAGHLHPVFAHPQLGPRALRVFWRRSGCLVLPSWGEFTGGARVDPAPGDGLYGCTPEGVLTLQTGSPT